MYVYLITTCSEKQKFVRDKHYLQAYVLASRCSIGMKIIIQLFKINNNNNNNNNDNNSIYLLECFSTVSSLKQAKTELKSRLTITY
jgi:hypothetical protein